MFSIKKANDKDIFRDKGFFFVFPRLFFMSFWYLCSLVLIFKRQLLYPRHKSEEKSQLPSKTGPGGRIKGNKPLEKEKGRIKDPWRVHWAKHNKHKPVSTDGTEALTGEEKRWRLWCLKTRKEDPRRVTHMPWEQLCPWSTRRTPVIHGIHGR